MSVGVFYSGYGGVRVPIGGNLIDDGSLAAASAIRNLDGSQVEKSSALGTAAYAAYGQNNAYKAVIELSKNSIVTMTSNTSPSGYTARDTGASANAYKAYDNSLSTVSERSGYTDYWNKLAHPETMVFAYGLIAGTSTLNRAPKDGYIQAKIGGVDTRIQQFEGLTDWATNGSIEHKWTLSKPIKATESLIWAYSNNGDAYTNITEFKIYGADLSTTTGIKVPTDITSLPDGTAVEVCEDVTVSGSVLPTGLVKGTTYYKKNVDSTHINLYTDSGLTSIVTLSSCGNGYFYINEAGKVNLPTVTDGILYY